MNWDSPLALLCRDRNNLLRNRWFCAALLPVVLATLVLIALPFSNGLQQRMMARFHLTGTRFSSWALTQPLPSMYSFANEAWLSDSPLSEQNLEKYPQLSIKMWCNHFPVQFMTCQKRELLLPGVDRQFLHLRSTYGDQQLFSRLEVHREPDALRLAVRYEDTTR